MPNNFFNNVRRKAIKLGKMFSRHNPRFEFSPNFVNNFPSDCGPAIALPGMVSNYHSTLLHHVMRILFRSAKKNMFRICTFWEVAFMKHAQTIWYWPKVKNPRSAMGGFFSAFFTTSSNVPIVLIQTSSFMRRPTPASGFKQWIFGWVRNRSVLVHLPPKSFRKCFGKSLRGQILGSNFDLHTLPFVDCVPRLRLLLQRAGNFFNSPMAQKQ